jgi:long-chain acyl-CoA synthetase
MLDELGFTAGQKAVIILPQSPEWVVAFFSILMKGGVVIPLEPAAPPHFVVTVCSKTRPALFFAHEPLLALGDTAAGRTIPMTSITLCRENVISPMTPHMGERDDLAEIVFTSGTTSQPKGVMLSHGNILTTVDPIRLGIEKHRRLVGLFPRIRMLCTVPYTHMFGQVTGIFLPVLLGSTVYLTDDTSPAALVRYIRKQRILTLITVPRIIKLLAEHARQTLHARGVYDRFKKHWEKRTALPYPLRVFSFLSLHRIMGLRFWSFIVGGASLDPDTHEFWRRTVFAVFQGYGLTETAPIVTMFNPFQHPRDSVGIVMPGQEVRLAPDGEILVHGGNVMQGYYKDTAGTEGVLKEGWLHTGDIGEMDEKGRIFIRGRKKEMILTSDGHNVYPLDVEHALNEQEGVRESVVFGKPGPSGESVHAVLLLEPNVEPEQIVRKANEILDSHQRVRDFTLWDGDDFPRTSTMKVKKGEVVQGVIAQEASSSETDTLFHGLAAGVPGEDARLSRDLGLDSLDMVELVCRLEKRYGISLDETTIGPDTTVSQIRALASQAPSAEAAGPSRQTTPSMPRWTKRTPVRLLRRILMDGAILPLFGLFCRIEVHGLDNLQQLQGPVILCANHQSDLDPLAVLFSLPGRYRKLVSPAMGLNRFHAHFQHLGRGPEERDGSRKKGRRKKGDGKTGYISRCLKGFGHHVGYGMLTFLFQTFPFPQGAAFRPSLEYTGELIDGGLWILIFPEGSVSRDGRVGTFKGGVSLIAEKTSVPVITVSIDGMHEVLPPQHWWPRRGRVVVIFGKPHLYAGEGHEQFATRLEESVRGMKDSLQD